jgi:hypothetical protein
MALIVSNGKVGDSGTHVALGVTEIIASGAFGKNRIVISVDADLGDEAPVHTFAAPGAISLQTAADTSITATIVGSDAGSLIDVTCNP